MTTIASFFVELLFLSLVIFIFLLRSLLFHEYTVPLLLFSSSTIWLTYFSPEVYSRTAWYFGSWEHLTIWSCFLQNHFLVWPGANSFSHSHRQVGPGYRKALIVFFRILTWKRYYSTAINFCSKAYFKLFMKTITICLICFIPPV